MQSLRSPIVSNKTRELFPYETGCTRHDSPANLIWQWKRLMRPYNLLASFHLHPISSNKNKHSWNWCTTHSSIWKRCYRIKTKLIKRIWKGNECSKKIWTKKNGWKSVKPAKLWLCGDSWNVIAQRKETLKPQSRCSWWLPGNQLPATRLACGLHTPMRKDRIPFQDWRSGQQLISRVTKAMGMTRDAATSVSPLTACSIQTGACWCELRQKFIPPAATVPFFSSRKNGSSWLADLRQVLVISRVVELSLSPQGAPLRGKAS